MKKFSEIEVGQRFWYLNEICQKIDHDIYFRTYTKSAMSPSVDFECDLEWWHYVENPTSIQLMQGEIDGAEMLGIHPRFDSAYTFAPRRDWREPTEADIGKMVEVSIYGKKRIMRKLIWVENNRYYTINTEGMIDEWEHARIRT